ncbi:hypothetical protein LTR56_003771 [Elasticomyces elasticus]|nr:hypothetical protein LTR22_013169 [Elasticomyces elasticus]KAK3654913.1 hypothetical protein LTR56_003771 [Elasticomyces elasticus]KAK4928757.1 hypothetical protein LTR49_004566 [Elasticomyces elasticus]KAK5766616.1 hypothetical protein LTS12_003235 [Elasticomyces elasticus]
MPNHISQDRHDAIRGVLYLLQHHPSDLDSRDKQAAAINDLLARHTFYHNGLQTRRVHNLTSFRAVAEDLAREAIIPFNHFEDRVDVLCRVRLEGVHPAILNLYDYDTDTFVEEDLPAFEQAAEPASIRSSQGEVNSFIQRAMWILLCDIEVVKEHSGHADYKYRSKEHILAALKHLITVYDLRKYATNADGKRDLLDSNAMLKDIKHMYWANNTHPPTRGSKNKRQHQKDAVANATPLWLTGKDRMPPRYLWTLQECAAHREQRDGLSAYDENDTITFSRDVLSKLAELNIEHEQNDDATMVKQPNSSDDGLEFKAGMSKAEVQRRLKKRKFAEANSDETGTSNSLVPVSGAMSTETPDAALETISRNLPQHGDSLGGPVGQVATRIKSLKRSDEQPPQHPQASAETQGASASPTYKSESQAEETAREATSLPQLVPSTQARLEDVKLSPLDLAEVANTLSDLSSIAQETVDRLFAALKLPLTQDSPLIKGLEPELLALYQRCWGLEWLTVCETLREGRFLTASDALRSLIAAYLHDNIFAGSPAWQVLLKRMVRFDSYMNNVFEKQHLVGMIDDLFSPHDASQDAGQSFGRELYADALTRLVANSTHLDHTAHQQSSDLASRLLHILEPYLRRLDIISESMNPHRMQQKWQETLQEDLTDLIKRAVVLKARLVGASLSEFQHTFMWCSQGTAVDAASMRAKNGMSTVTAEQVAYTLFPGLQAQHPRGTTSKVSFAEVVAQPQVPQV